MPPPYLVNADGNPYPPKYQQIVCACRPRHKCEQSTSGSEEAGSFREYVEGSSRLDAVIARLQRERHDLMASNNRTDSSDSGIGSSQMEESNVGQRHGTATYDLSETGQRTVQPSRVTFAEGPFLEQTQFTGSSDMSDLQGPSHQAQLAGTALRQVNAMYGNAYGLVGGSLEQPHAGPAMSSWPVGSVPLTHAGSLPLTHAGSLQNSVPQPMFGASSWMAPVLPYGSLYQTMRPSSSNAVNIMQSPGVGMNLHHEIREPQAFPGTLPAKSQPASLTSRLRPIAPKPAPLGASLIVGDVVSSAAESGPSRLDADPFQSQPTNVSGVEAMNSHVVSSSQSHSVAEARIPENRESRDAPAAGELPGNQQLSTNSEPLSGSVASFLGLDHKDALMWWRSRIIVPDIPPPLAMHQELRRQFLADEELKLFAEESSKLPCEAEDEEPSDPVQPVDSPRTQRRRRRNALQQQLAEAAANALAANRGRSRAVSMRSDEEFAVVSSSSSAEEFEEEWHMSRFDIVVCRVL